jgi:competence protein ComEA
MKTLGRHDGTPRFALALALLLVLCAAALAPTMAAQTDSKANSASAAPARQVDLNKASAEELATIPGIGVALAQRIVEFREKEGAFRRVEDLMKVKGIGEKSFQKMQPHVKVEAKS